GHVLLRPDDQTVPHDEEQGPHQKCGRPDPERRVRFTAVQGPEAQRPARHDETARGQHERRNTLDRKGDPEVRRPPNEVYRGKRPENGATVKFSRHGLGAAWAPSESMRTMVCSAVKPLSEPAG